MKKNCSSYPATLKANVSARSPDARERVHACLRACVLAYVRA